MTAPRAIILAAGKGLRMRPLTEQMPKPLVPVAGACLIDYALDFALAGGIAEVVVNASYLADMLEAHLARRSAPRITISREAEPLETGGGIREALPLLGAAPFFSINSDVICVDGAENALVRLAKRWDDARMDALLLLHPRARAIGYEGPGDFFLNADGTLKRRGSSDLAPYVFAGIQLLHPRLFEGCPKTEAFSMNVLYNRGMTSEGVLPRVFGLVHEGDWLHVGDPHGRALAERYFLDRAR